MLQPVLHFFHQHPVAALNFTQRVREAVGHAPGFGWEQGEQALSLLLQFKQRIPFLGLAGSEHLLADFQNSSVLDFQGEWHGQGAVFPGAISDHAE